MKQLFLNLIFVTPYPAQFVSKTSSKDRYPFIVPKGYVELPLNLFLWKKHCPQWSNRKEKRFQRLKSSFLHSYPNIDTDRIHLLCKMVIK